MDETVAWKAEQRYRAVLEVRDGSPVSEVAATYGVSRQTIGRGAVQLDAAGEITDCSPSVGITASAGSADLGHENRCCGVPSVAILFGCPHVARQQRDGLPAADRFQQHPLRGNDHDRV